MPLSASSASAGTASPDLLADQALDRVILFGDLDADGDTDDAGEATAFFDAANGAGLPGPTNPFALIQAGDGAFWADGEWSAILSRSANGTILTGAGPSRSAPRRCRCRRRCQLGRRRWPGWHSCVAGARRTCDPGQSLSELRGRALARPQGVASPCSRASR